MFQGAGTPHHGARGWRHAGKLDRSVVYRVPCQQLEYTGLYTVVGVPDRVLHPTTLGVVGNKFQVKLNQSRATSTLNRTATISLYDFAIRQITPLCYYSAQGQLYLINSVGVTYSGTVHRGA
jgi:hypothetical protein